jgi:dipeptidyl aminopeptidase/acylaminoacyl peptidase
MKKRDEIGRSLLISARLAIIAWTLTLCAAPGRAVEPATPLEVYGRLPSLENLVISPDGSRAAYVRTDGERRDLVVVAMSPGKLLGGAHVGDIKHRNLTWLDDDHLLIEVSSTSLPPIGFFGDRQEWPRLLIFDIPNKKLTPVEFRVSDAETFNVIIGEPMVRTVAGATVLFVPGLYVSDRTYPGLFRFDIADRRVKLVSRGKDDLSDWLVDEAGNIAGQLTYADAAKRWQLRVPDGRGTRVLASGTAPIDFPRLLGFSARGDAALVRFVENGDPVWKPLSLKDGSWGDPLSANEKFDEVIEDRKSSRIMGGVVHDRLVFFDNELQAHWNATLRAFPDEVVTLKSHSDDYSRIVVSVFGAKDGYVYALFDWYSHQTAVLGKVYEGLAAVSEVRSIAYKASDGLEIPGYVTLPRGRPATGLPLVLLPHGGPAASDTDDFDWWAQAIADQGYAVLQPNFRGSDLNQGFMSAGFGQWGRKMQSDLSDGIDFLTKQGIVDPKRVCIVGGSYGGYAALAGMTLQPGVYRCGVSVAGVADLRRMLEWSGQGRSESRARRYWERFMGASSPNDPALQAISPIEHVGAVNGPILLIHGKDDTVVPYEQSDRMADALKRAGKRVDLVTLKHEDHWLSRSETRLQMLEATVAFLKANNPPY